MDLKDIISISGKSGLFSIVGKSKNNVIVESLSEKKRFPIFNTNKISALADISIYTYDEEILLSEIFQKIFEEKNDEKVISHNESSEELKTEFIKFVPNYDKEQVYISDIKKLFQWYNILHDTNNLKPKKKIEENSKESSEEKNKEESQSN